MSSEGTGGVRVVESVDPAPVRAMHVLLVEDDDGDALLVEEMLADANEQVRLDRVVSMAEVVSAPVDVDCVLLDLQLPDADGLSGLATLRNHVPGTAVVVLTGRNDETGGLAAVAAGAQDYLLKGQVDGQLLIRALRYAWERTRAEMVEQQLLEQQLMARENSRLERGLLPTPLLNDPDLVLETRYRPGRDGSLLGGDFYDAVQLPDGTLQAVIGDVSGHGPDEAALGVALRIAWRSVVLAGLPTDQVLATVEQVLVHERINQSFASLSMISIDPARTTLRLCLAGHPSPLLIQGDDVRMLPDGHRGVPLGILDDASWQTLEVSLRPGWALLLYTDGLFEGRIGAGSERLGQENMTALLARLLRDHPGWPDRPSAVVDELIAEVVRLNGGPLDDDLALALLSHRPAGTVGTG